MKFGFPEQTLLALTTHYLLRVVGRFFLCLDSYRSTIEHIHDSQSKVNVKVIVVPQDDPILGIRNCFKNSRAVDYAFAKPLRRSVESPLFVVGRPARAPSSKPLAQMPVLTKGRRGAQKSEHPYGRELF